MNFTLKKIKKSFLFDLFCIVWVGLLSMLSFAPYYLTHLVWIAPFGVYWIYNKYKNQYKKLITRGLMIGIVFYFFSYHWMIHMATEFGNFPFPIAFIILVLAGLIFNLKFPIFLVLFSFLKKRVKGYPILLAGFSGVVAEILSPQIFPWYYGNLLAGNIFFAQTAEYFGVYGLSFVVFISSYFLFLILTHHRVAFFYLKQKKKANKKFIFLFILPSVVLVSFFLLGVGLYAKWEKIQPEGFKNVLIIQPDSPLSFRDGRSIRESIEELMERIELLTIQGSENLNIDLVVLPEAGVPFFSAHNHKPTSSSFTRIYWERFDSLMFILANRLKANVFFNELDAMFYKGIESEENLRYLNNNVLYDSNGERRSSYKKKYLLPFGEYMPFEFLYDLSPQTGRFSPGVEFNLIPYFDKIEEHETDSVIEEKTWKDTESLDLVSLKEHYNKKKDHLIEAGSFLPLICYEVILPEFVREFRNSGIPDFIVNLTNDKWYGNSIESYQHYELGRLRTIETRKWMVRSTNSGISNITNHLGELTSRNSKLMDSDFLIGEVGILRTPPTFFTTFGNLPLYSSLSLMLIFFIFKIRKSVKL